MIMTLLNKRCDLICIFVFYYNDLTIFCLLFCCTLFIYLIIKVKYVFGSLILNEFWN